MSFRRVSDGSLEAGFIVVTKIYWDNLTRVVRKCLQQEDAAGVIVFMHPDHAAPVGVG